jgi:hypothetical protein
MISEYQRLRLALGELQAVLMQQYVLVEKYNPDQPRIPAGSNGGSATGFVSPNVRNLTFNEAVEALDSKEQERLSNASEDIDKRLGIFGH